MHSRKRNENEKIIIAKVSECGAMTKYDLAEQMNISIPTVTTNVNKLLKEGVLIEVGVADSEYGRKPLLIDIDYTRYFGIGIDIQYHYIYYCLMNLKLEVVLEKTIRSTNNNLGESIKTIVKTILEDCQLQKQNIIGIGLSYPGFVEEQKLLLKRGPNIGISNLSLEALKDELDLNIYVGNEARFAAFAENRIGVSKDYMNSFYLSIKAGIGAGIIVDKRYYTGSSEAAGEIGHMVIQKGGRACNCGNKGCVEPYLSTDTLIKAFSTAKGKTFTTLDEVFKAYNRGEAQEREILREYADYLVITLNNIFLIFDPECVIIGGEMSEYQKQIEPFIEEALQSNQCSMLKGDRLIKFSTLGYKASKYGAALMALQEITALV